MNSRHKRRAEIVLVMLLIVATTVYAMRRPILRAAGWALVADENVEPADVIVVTVNADGAGALEAADLVHSGRAVRVAVFAETMDMVEREFNRRELPYEGAAARTVRQLQTLGVDTVESIPGAVAGSEDEGPALATWCDQNRIRTVIVVSTSDHSRRLRRMLRRAMKGRSTRVMLRSARYSTFNPDEWWESHVGTRIEIEEMEKLLLDIVRHPIP
jgi:hypothetical protein